MSVDIFADLSTEVTPVETPAVPETPATEIAPESELRVFNTLEEAAEAGYVPVGEFVKAATKQGYVWLQNPDSAHMVQNGDFYVDYAKVNLAVKAKNNPFPHGVIRTISEVPVLDEAGAPVNDENGTAKTETVIDDKIVVNLADIGAWFNRPPATRGRGAGRKPASEDTVEDRVLRAGKSRARKVKVETRLAKLRDELEKLVKLTAKQEAILTRDGKTVADADVAYTEWLSTQDAAKAIADDADAETPAE